jgi:hypothetical protein
MEILISFTTTVGVVEALRTTKDVAVDIVNQSIVQWLKNKKFPSVGGGSINSRDTNAKPPSSSIATSTMFAYKKVTTVSETGGLEQRGNGTYYFKTKTVNVQRVSTTIIWTYPPGTDMSGFSSPPWSVGDGTATLNESGEPGTPGESGIGEPLWAYEYTIQNGGYSAYSISQSNNFPDGGYNYSFFTASWNVTFR